MRVAPKVRPKSVRGSAVQRLAGALADVIDGSRRGVVENFIWGLYWSLCATVVLCALALVVYLLAGAAPFRATEVSLTAALLGYAIAGAVVGLVLGGLRPLTRSPVGSSLVGFVCAAVVALSLRVADKGLASWTDRDLLVSLVFALLFGPAGGVYLRRWGIRWREELGK